MRVVVPLGIADPKTRLGPFLNDDEREAFALAMACDVLDALETLGYDPTVLVDAPLETVDGGGPQSGGRDPALDRLRAADRTVDERPLTAAVEDTLPATPDDDPTAVVMADLPLATPDALARLFDLDADVAVAPGRGGGTNALVARHPDFRVDYHGASILDHRERARDAGLSVAEVDSVRLATDVDERADLVEVLLHAEGRAREWLDAAGVELARSAGRVDVRRSSNGN